ncbi:MAG: hypothetical protein AABZ74_18360 [Cyanobacteriota bacterium]
MLIKKETESVIHILSYSDVTKMFKNISVALNINKSRKSEDKKEYLLKIVAEIDLFFENVDFQEYEDNLDIEIINDFNRAEAYRVANIDEAENGLDKFYSIIQYKILLNTSSSDIIKINCLESVRDLIKRNINYVESDDFFIEVLDC